MRKLSTPPFLEGLSTLFKMNLDTLTNLSRDSVIFPTGNTPVEEDLAALFIGGSNADRVANSAASSPRPSPQPAGSCQRTLSQPSSHK
jgi:hypothetical protein